MGAGTKDFLPGDMRARAWLFGLWTRVGEQFGFEMVEGPVLESEDLFVRKAGEEIVGQLYNFQVSQSRLLLSRLLMALHRDPGRLWQQVRAHVSMLAARAAAQDKGGRRVALRPELTPTLARLALQKGKGLSLPAKWSQVTAGPAAGLHQHQHDFASTAHSFPTAVTFSDSAGTRIWHVPACLRR